MSDEERVVLVPREHAVLLRALVPVEIEVVHAGIAEEPVVLGDERLDARVRHELVQIDVLLDPLAPDGVVRPVDLAEQSPGSGCRACCRRRARACAASNSGL